MMRAIWQDIRFGLRQMARNPTFTAIVVLCLALGIGTNTAIFSIIYEALLRPLAHYKDPDRIVSIIAEATSDNGPVGSFVCLDELEKQSTCLVNMAPYQPVQLCLRSDEGTQEVWGVKARKEYFETLGIRPFMGRVFDSEDCKPDAPPAAIISHGLWVRHFDSDANVVGRDLKLTDKVATIVGVMPAKLWIPLRYDTDVWVADNSLESSKPDGQKRVYCAVARIRSGVSLAQARAETDRTAAQLAKQHPELTTGYSLRLSPFNRARGRTTELWLLLVAAGFVLLIACANVANLVLTRMTYRQHEIAVRAALGASRARLARQMLIESLLLGLLAGAAGLLLASWGVHLFVALAPAGTVRIDEVGFNLPMFLSALAVSLLMGAVIAVFPALRALVTSPNATLKQAGRGLTEGRLARRFRSLLVIGEIALAFVLLTGAGLMLDSFRRLLSVDVGFNPKNVLTMTLHESLEKLNIDPLAGHRKVQEVLQRVQQLPGVQSAAFGHDLPLDMGSGGECVEFPGGDTGTQEQKAFVTTDWVGPGYFETMRIPLLRGRTFKPDDEREAWMGRSRATIVNEAMVKRYWPGQEPIGKLIRVGERGPERTLQVVGVVANVRTGDLESQVRPALYTCNYCWGFGYLAVRAARNPTDLVPAIRRVIADVDKDMAIMKVATMEEYLEDQLSQPRFVLCLLGFHAALALILATLGIYGVMAHSVSRRTHEIGIRMALGAQRGNVLLMVLKRGLIITGIGLAIGAGGAFALMRYLASVLYEVSPTDPMTFTAAASLLGAVALFACHIPARRATKIDPLVAIRYE
jgi:putative ABC transport system permease protein